MTFRHVLSRLSQTFIAAATLLFIATLALFASWLHDRSRLHAIATSVTARSGNVEDQLSRLTAWVYANKGFKKNSSYFLWKPLEATPIQVLNEGGDCEDKSKLLSSLIEELGIPATMAMLYHCEGECRPVHTVALAKTRSGWTPLDAVYNITFQQRDGRAMPVETMMQQPRLLNARLDQLARLRGPGDRINYYKRHLETYTHLTTVNWNKNAATQAVASLIRLTGADPRLTPRPLFLDDPKQFFSIVGFGLTALLLLMGLGLERLRQRVASRKPGTGAASESAPA